MRANMLLPTLGAAVLALWLLAPSHASAQGLYYNTTYGYYSPTYGSYIPQYYSYGTATPYFGTTAYYYPASNWATSYYPIYNWGTYYAPGYSPLYAPGYPTYYYPPTVGYRPSVFGYYYFAPRYGVFYRW